MYRSRRLFSTVAVPRSFGFALDIDGCVKRGAEVLEAGRVAVHHLVKNDIPFVFLTNGGGKTEHRRASELSKDFGVRVSVDQVILSHTPLRQIAISQKWELDKDNEAVLVIGSGSVKEVAHEYGWGDNVVTPHDIHAIHPEVFPHSKPFMHDVNPWLQERKHRIFDIRFPKIVIMHDPVYWGVELQIVCDLLRCNGYIAPARSHTHIKRPVQLINTNCDLEYAATYPIPRFGQGAFYHTLVDLFPKLSGAAIPFPHVLLLGKPSRTTYQFAEMQIKKVNGGSPVERFYGIGDNPASDIQGANNAGDHWTSVLVRTGCFSPNGAEENSSAYPADQVHVDVWEAVKTIIAQEKRSA